ncbi:hypothetical protein ACERZ8_15505 [Tateyamaria armeniaca]|uniref:Transglutaminase-like domain-containing protein n=1 Tax=Tateyamaria armeniaca TaxID=2518930 RepID=A0ABW8UWB9_9RHOB
MNTQSAAEFYRHHGEWSDPGRFAGAFDAIPRDIRAIASTVQGLLLHDYFGAHLYPDPPTGIADASRATLPISERLPAVTRFGETPLTTARPVHERAVRTCRDFALMTCSILRHHQIAARVRCGFSHYFHPPTFEDHWICEYRDDTAQAWKTVDAQLDHEHQHHLSIYFDHTDMPRDQFLFSWQVWERFGNDHGALQDFGQGESKGFWFVRVSLARDVLALTKREVSEWDTWRDHRDEDKVASAIAQCNALAAASKHFDTAAQFDVTAFNDVIAELDRPHWAG